MQILNSNWKLSFEYKVLRERGSHAPTLYGCGCRTLIFERSPPFIWYGCSHLTLIFEHA